MQASRAGTISVVSDQAPKISRRLRVKLFHAISKNLYGCAWDFRSFSQEGYNTIKFFNQNVKSLLPTGYYPHLVWLKPFFLRRLSFHKYHSIYLIRRFGVLYRGVFLRVELYLTSPQGESKYKQRFLQLFIFMQVLEGGKSGVNREAVCDRSCVMLGSDWLMRRQLVT